MSKAVEYRQEKMPALQLEHLPLLSAKHLSFRHHGSDNEYDLHDINLEIEQGAMVALMGRQGSGRTTFCHLLRGDLKPARGSYLSLAGRNPWAERHLVARDASVITSLSSRPAWASPRFLAVVMKQFYPRFNREYFLYVLETHDIDVDHHLSELSESQMSYLRMVMTLASNTHLIILDELAPPPEREYLHKFNTQDLKHYMELGNSAIIVPERLHDVESVLTHVLVLDEGRKVLYESREDLAEHYVILEGGGAMAIDAQTLKPLYASGGGSLRSHMLFDKRKTSATALQETGMNMRPATLSLFAQMFTQVQGKKGARTPPARLAGRWRR